MLLLHGFTGSSASWGADLVDGLASGGWLPVPVDLPGHGRHAGESDPARFTQAAVFRSLREAAGEEPCPLVGYSMGGRLALAYAVHHPRRVTHLVLESASPGLPTQEERAQRRTTDEALADRIEARGIAAFVEEWESLTIFESQGGLPEEVRVAQRARRLRNDPHSLGAALRGLGTGALPSHWGALHELDVPVLLLVGSLDEKFTRIARSMEGSLPRARTVVVEGAGHAVHLERPGAWLTAVLSFLGKR